MHCQTVIKSKNKFRSFVGPTTETRRSDDGAVRSKKRLPKWQKGKFTKHYFEGTNRIVSKLGEGTFHQPSGLMAGGIDYVKQSAKVQEAIDSYIRGLNVPPGPPTQHGIYGTPDFTGQEYPSIDWSDISQDQEPPEGWPRPPKFNEPGDVPGPPVQYGDPVKPDNVKGGFGYVDNGIEERNLYYYHPDHLGSSSYITDKDGNINQHTEYMAFGEVLFDEHKVSRRMPYLFNGKELDSETGLYYYGARYYDARVSIFLNVDPLAEKYPFTLPYTYVNNNPIRFIDPDGRSPLDVIITFNKSTGKLAIIDLDHYQKGLPAKIVSAKDYVHGGIRDNNGKLTHNQILVIEKVFSGGKSTNGVVERDPKRPQQKPIPNGTFDLLDNDADTKHIGWFRLDKQDENLYNDKEDATGRDGFRFHLGTESWGCITCDVSQGDRQKEWNVVTEILNSTSTTTVPEKRGKQGWNPFSWLTKYGTVRVIGEDKIPTKKENK
ncbi:hypothetical protein PG593_08630 [Riemerella anatipestifer]|nr:hypothetical protein [Riemerella anatipestifer]